MVPGRWPLGYANANAALAVQGVSAAGMAAAASRREGRVCFGWHCPQSSRFEAPLTRSAAGTVLALVVLVVSVVMWVVKSRLARSSSFPPPPCPVAPFRGSYRIRRRKLERGGIPDVAVESLSERRPHLWHDALIELLREPVRGVGPGLFAYFSPLASATPMHAGRTLAFFSRRRSRASSVGCSCSCSAGWAFVALAEKPRTVVAAMPQRASLRSVSRPQWTISCTSPPSCCSRRFSSVSASSRSVSSPPLPVNLVSPRGPGKPGLMPPSAVTPDGRTKRSNVMRHDAQVKEQTATLDVPEVELDPLPARTANCDPGPVPSR